MGGVSTGIEHTLSWSVSDLYNCDLFAIYNVVDTEGLTSDENSLTWDELYAYHLTTDAKTLYTPTSYYGFNYSVSLYNNVKEGEELSLYDSLTATAPGAHPPCGVEASMTSELSIEDGKIVVYHDWTVTESYTCVIETITASLLDNEFTTEEVASVSS